MSMDSNEVDIKTVEITKKVRAIVMFGPPTPTSGFRPAEYYQVVIDPNMKSPSGEFIRFDQPWQGGELHGWQRIDALTVCEILGEETRRGFRTDMPEGYVEEEGASVTMRACG